MKPLPEGLTRTDEINCRRVLSVLRQSGKPLATLEIHELVCFGGGSVGKDRIYRVLGIMLEAGIVRRQLREEIGQAAPSKNPHGGFHPYFWSLVEP